MRVDYSGETDYSGVVKYEGDVEIDADEIWENLTEADKEKLREIFYEEYKEDYAEWCREDGLL